MSNHDPRHFLRGQDGCGVRPRRVGARELPRPEGGRRRSDRRRRQCRQPRQGRAGGLHHGGFAKGVVGEFRSAGADARRAADPSGAALDRAGGATGRRRGDRRYRTVLPGTPPSCAGCAVRRHHRHQRQIDHDGADRAFDAGRRLRHPDGRQYRHRDPVAGAAAHGAGARHRDVVVPDRSFALARSLRRHPAQCQRRSHRSPRHARTLCRGEGASGRRRAERGHRDRRRRRRLLPQHRRPHRAGRPARGPGLGEKSASRRRLCRARNHLARLRRRAQRDRADRRHRLAARPAQCAERGLRRGLRARARRLHARSCKTACAAFPVSRTAWSRSAAAAMCCSSTIPRAPMRTRRRMRCRPLPISSGSPAASRSSAASPA